MDKRQVHHRNYERMPQLEIKDAIQEARRCLQCPRPLCQSGCPINNDIKDFIGEIAKGNLGSALSIILAKSNLPAVCGRVCPKELQCEGHCVLSKKGTAIKIGYLEHFVADMGFVMDLEPNKIPPKTRGNVAVIGSGPAGLTVAGDLAKTGFHVSIYEGEQEAGGVLLYGIPSFRLSNHVVQREVARIESLGVNIHTGQMIGPDLTIDHLFDRGHDAVFIGTGTPIARALDIPNHHIHGIIQASYLLHSLSLLQSKLVSQEDVPLNDKDAVVVIGGGNVAMDAARSARRYGVDNVTVVYHRKEEELSALKTEYEEAKKDGVKFLFQASTVEYLPHRDGKKVAGVILDTPDGRKSIPGDKIFLAIGSKPANRIVSTTKGIDIDERGYVITRERPYGMTTRRAVFAGGDVVHQPATVVLAMREAQKVAKGISEYVDAVRLIASV